MAITKKIRRTASPLNAFCSLKVKAGEKYDSTSGATTYNYCPLLQVYDNNKLKYIVDRSSVPTVIVPIIRLQSKDNNMVITNSGLSVANVTWYVQRSSESAPTIISSHSEWTGHYAVTQSGDELGALTITKNIAVGDSYALWCEIKYADTRTGNTIVVPITSEKVMLSTAVNTDEQYSLSIDRQNGEGYDILLDKRIEYDYRKAKGLLADGETFTDNGNTYLRTIHYYGKKGNTSIVEGTDYTIRIDRLDGSTFTRLTESDDEIESITTSEIVLNLSYLDKATFRISMVVNDAIVYYLYYGFNRENGTPDSNAFAATLFNGTTEKITGKCAMSYNGKNIAYPEAYTDIVWSSKSENGSKTQRGGGETISLDCASVIGSSDNWLNLEAEVTVRGNRENLTDENGNILTDENGNVIYEF